MAGTHLYKNTANNAHRVRYLTNEDNFSSGMRYTNAPQSTGYAKTIVNFNIKNDGEYLAPRGGFRTTNSKIASILAAPTYTDYCVHHAHSMYISNADETDSVLCQYTLFGGVEPEGFDLSTAVLLVEYNGKYLQATRSVSDDANAINTGTLLMRPSVTNMQGMEINTPVARNGIYTSLEANTYVLVNIGNKNVLGRIVAKFNEDFSSIVWRVQRVVPVEIQPTQAINYGYNMFKDNPYTFVNTTSATGAIELTGVVPYGEDGKLLLTARPGTPITFKLYYKYPESDKTANDKYLVQWEVQDLNNSSVAEVIQKVRNSAEYTPGDEIKLNYTPAFTAFSLIVRIYKKTEIAESDAAWQADTALQALVTKDDNLTPNQVTTLASYYLTSNSNTTILNVDAVAYDMGTATGMCTWQQRIVMWGVTNAKSTLFVSEINNPGYMPYPNNSEIFSDDIICAVPYMSNLLVFTKSSLYKLTLNEDGISYTSTCVQERLSMVPSDINTVVTVQNMVYFKSSNYFYMIVPNNTSATSDVQMAPVSRPIEQILDNLQDTFAGLLNDVYNMTYDDINDDIEIHLLDYHAYLDDTQIRNVYKVLVNLYVGADKENPKPYYIDISLNYDTVLRAWTVYMYETTPYRMVVYKPTVTGKSIYAHLHVDSYIMYMSLVQADAKVPADDLELNEGNARTYGNNQFIESGYRDFNEDMKKRFREVQFCVNIPEPTQLKFHTEFIVDDVDVVSMYNHIVSQCTDRNDSNYGTIFVERVLREGIDTPALTELDTWELDTAQFPDITMNKVRYHVSGKGYGGSVKILSLNEAAYELLHINWVYRVMFAR